ncbi:MAG: DNA-binding protein [Chloroflexi bacterium]|nr:DNA-binding protein [Chloroflexota bacterium]
MIAIIADIVHSRKLKNRERIQSDLSASLKRVNQVHAQVIASDFTITLGDEFQGLFKFPKGLFKALDEISVAMYPVRLRFGIGLGEITTKINRELSIGADGPAYWNAREAIQFVRRSNDYGRSNIHVIASNSSPELSLVNELLKATAMIAVNWRLTQIKVFRALLEEGLWTDKFDQGCLVRRLQISDSTLSQRLASSGLKLYLRARTEAEAALERIHHAQ